MILLAGIRAPSTQRTNPSTQEVQAADPFGDDAQLFVETRLLQRNVAASVLGLTPNGQIVADVKHPTQGSIVPHILKAGLAKCTDHHTTLLGAQMAALRQAEKFARDRRQGVYQGHVAPKANAPGELEAVVSRVQSADTIFLRNKVGAEKRINLSSVRQPKPTDPKQSPWVAEAKEFLRKKLIGKHIKFHIDGKRPGTEGYDEREMATVTYQERLFDAEVKRMNVEYLERMRRRFAESFRKIVAEHPPRMEVDLDALADHLTVIVEGAIVLSKALHDPGLMGKQTRLFRNHIKLIFGAK